MKEFEAIYDAYFSDVYKFILSIAKDAAVAEDVVQETFFKALRNIDNLRDETKLKSWLFQIAKNTYLSRVTRSVKTISIDEIEIASTQNTEVEFVNKDTVKQVRQLLHKMKEPYKEVFYLRVFAGLSFNEIAEIFDEKDTWARQTFHRAKLMIRKEL